MTVLQKIGYMFAWLLMRGKYSIKFFRNAQIFASFAKEFNVKSKKMSHYIVKSLNVNEKAKQC